MKVAFAADLVAYTCFLLVGLALYALFKDVHRDRRGRDAHHERGQRGDPVPQPGQPRGRRARGAAGCRRARRAVPRPARRRVPDRAGLLRRVAHPARLPGGPVRHAAAGVRVRARWSVASGTCSGSSSSWPRPVPTALALALGLLGGLSEIAFLGWLLVRGARARPRAGPRALVWRCVRRHAEPAGPRGLRRPLHLEPAERRRRRDPHGAGPVRDRAGHRHARPSPGSVTRSSCSSRPCSCSARASSRRGSPRGPVSS